MHITHSVQHSDNEKNYSIFQVQSQDGKELEEDVLNFLKNEIASEFESMDVKLTFFPSNGGDFMTEGMAQLDEETLGAVTELIRAVSDSKLRINESLDIIRGISGGSLGKESGGSFAQKEVEIKPMSVVV